MTQEVKPKQQKKPAKVTNLLLKFIIRQPFQVKSKAIIEKPNIPAPRTYDELVNECLYISNEFKFFNRFDPKRVTIRYRNQYGHIRDIDDDFELQEAYKQESPITLVVYRNQRPWMFIGALGLLAITFFRLASGNYAAAGRSAGVMGPMTRAASPRGASLVQRTVKGAMGFLL